MNKRSHQFARNSTGIRVLRALATQTVSLMTDEVHELLEREASTLYSAVDKALYYMRGQGYVSSVRMPVEGRRQGRLFYTITEAGRKKVHDFSPEAIDLKAQRRKEAARHKPVVTHADMEHRFTHVTVAASEAPLDLHPEAVRSVFELADREAFRQAFSREQVAP